MSEEATSQQEADEAATDTEASEGFVDVTITHASQNPVIVKVNSGHPRLLPVGQKIRMKATDANVVCGALSLSDVSFHAIKMAEPADDEAGEGGESTEEE